MTGIPCSRKTRETVDLPLPNLPVIPTRNARPKVLSNLVLNDLVETGVKQGYEAGSVREAAPQQESL